MTIVGFRTQYPEPGKGDQNKGQLIVPCQPEALQEPGLSDLGAGLSDALHAPRLIGIWELPKIRGP